MDAFKRLPMARRGTGSTGKSIELLANHFRLDMGRNKGYFFHYDVALRNEDGKSVQAKGIGRKVLDEVWRTCTELAEFSFAYDGDQSLFTLHPLPCEKQQYTVELKQTLSRRVGSPDKRLNGGNIKIHNSDINYETTIPLRAIENTMDDQASGNSSEAHDVPNNIQRQHAATIPRSRLKVITVDINYVAKIPLQEIANALSGQNSGKFQEALRVLNMVLRQHDAERGCLFVRHSFFQSNEINCMDIGGGVLACGGFRSSFRSTQRGLSLNVDVSNTMIVKPGPVVDFLLQNQNVGNIKNINWTKAKKIA